VHRRRRRRDVDPEIRQVGPQACERHAAPDLREERREASVAPVGPERVDELAACHRAVAVEDEVGDEQPPLPAGQVALDAAACDLHHEAAAELHFRRPQSGANIDATAAAYNSADPTRGGNHGEADHV
jgi:hypothetical protein